MRHEATTMPESVRPSERVRLVPAVGARTPREEREQQTRKGQKSSTQATKETLQTPESPPEAESHALDVEV
ncbi:MAG: hypothetical protein WHS44_02780 [Fimbriimonadales bacterium]